MVSKTGRIIELFKEERWTVADIAAVVAVKPQMVYQVIKREGLKRTRLNGADWGTIGAGVTMHVGSDRYPATIIEIGVGGDSFVAQEDDAKVVEGSMHDGSAKYEYSVNTAGRTFKVRQDQEGDWREVRTGNYVSTGRRRYYDPSF